MALFGGLQQIFENPPPENPSLLESLSSWKQIRSLKSIDQSYTELFGELHFRETTETSLPSAWVGEAAASWSSGSTSLTGQDLDSNKDEDSSPSPFSCYSTKSAENHLLNPESLQLCTEGLGFESLDGVEDMKNESSNDFKNSVSGMEKAFVRENSTSYMGSDQYKISKSCGSLCPPPISCIGRAGKTRVSFKSHRQDGRFVLEEVRTSTQQYLHASREDGRLRLCLVQHNDNLGQEEEEEEEEEEDEDDDDEEENDDHHDHDR